jgi:hypothetical protein
MAQARVEIICKECGCEFTHKHICYNRDDAKRYEEWVAENITICPECYGKQKRAEERARLDAATETANHAIEENGVELSELTGTEKQISWATDIRARGVKMFVDAGAKERAWEVLNAKTDAKWWIENQHLCDPNTSNAKWLLKELLK